MKIRGIIVLSLFIGLLAGQNITVSGTYLDQKGNPIADAKVTYAQAIAVVDSAITASNGAFSLTIPTVGTDDDAKVARQFGLSQNYPNPFNPTTRFTATLKEPGSVSIYNILGQQVDQLSLPGFGEYTITWGGASSSGNLVSAGIYFYVLRSDNKTVARKMTLLDKGDGGWLGIAGWNVEKDIAGAARTLPSWDELSFVKDNTSTLLLNFNTPLADSSLGIVTGNVGPTVLANPPDTTITVGDTLIYNLLDYVYNDNKTWFSDTNSPLPVMIDSLFTFIGVGVGSWDFVINATDSADAALHDSLGFAIDVIQPNRSPVLTDSIPDIVIDEDSTATIDLSQYFTDPDGDVLQYTISGLGVNHHAQITGNICVLYLQPNWNGSILGLSISASDGEYSTESNDFSMEVIAVNDAPVITFILSVDHVVEDSDDLPIQIAVFSVDDVDSGDVITDPVMVNSDTNNVHLRLTGNEVWVDSLTAEFYGDLQYTLSIQDSSGAVAQVIVPLTIIGQPDVTFNIRSLREYGAPIMNDILSTFQIGDSTYQAFGSITKQLMAGESYDVFAFNDSTGVFDTTGALLGDSHIFIRTADSLAIIHDNIEKRDYSDDSSILTFGNEDITLELYKIVNLAVEDYIKMHLIMNNYSYDGVDKPNTLTPEVYINTNSNNYGEPDSVTVARVQDILNNLFPLLTAEYNYYPQYAGFAALGPADPNGTTIFEYDFDTAVSPPGFSGTDGNSNNVIYKGNVRSPATGNSYNGLAVESAQGFIGAFQADPADGTIIEDIFLDDGQGNIAGWTDFAKYALRIWAYASKGSDI